MAFTVEDGTGVVGANSYVSVAYADEFFSDRGNSEWQGTDAVKQSLLIEATDYIEMVYGRRFIGEMADTAQALSWPRSGTDDYLDSAYAADEIPTVLKRACCRYALQSLISGPLAPTPVVDETGLPVVTTRKAVGPIEKEFRLAGSSSRPAQFRSYPAADGLMASLLIPGSGQVIR